MKKLNIVLLLLGIVVTMSVSVSAAEVVGIGFEFGTNYVMDVNGEPGGSQVFNLDFKLSDELAIGYYQEDVTGTAPFASTGMISAIQVKNSISDSFESGVRFGTHGAGNVYSGVFGTYNVISNKSANFNGNLNINLGYDFIPNVQDGDLFKVGLASLIRF
ncbi:MAG: hypothetical protein ACQEP9_07530 [Bacillota bacterium]